MESMHDILVRQFGPVMDFNCSTHGLYRAHRDSSECPLCFDIKEKEKEAAIETDRRTRILASRWAESGMPEKFREVSFDDWLADSDEKKKVKQMAKWFAEGALKRWLIIGPCRTGKTMLVAATLRAMVNNGKEPLYTSATRMLRSVRDTWGKRGVDEQAVMDKYIKANVLAVDEIGAGTGSDNDMVILSEIICDRYAANLPTVLISNLLADDLKKYAFDDRAVVRIRDGEVTDVKWDAMPYAQQ